MFKIKDIKVFHKQYKIICNVSNIDFNDEIIDLNPDSKDLHLFPDSEDWIYSAKDTIVGFEAIVFLYSSGLKDRYNDELIYSGDIVGIPYSPPFGDIEDKWTYKAEVFYDYGCFWLRYLTSEYEHPVPQQIIDWVVKSRGKYISNFGEPTIYSNKTVLEKLGNVFIENRS